MHILDNYSCFSKLFIFYPKKKPISTKNIFEDLFFFNESGYIPDFENEDNVVILDAPIKAGRHIGATWCVLGQIHGPWNE